MAGTATSPANSADANWPTSASGTPRDRLSEPSDNEEPDVWSDARCVELDDDFAIAEPIDV
jgi:hypothetical protein